MMTSPLHLTNAVGNGGKGSREERHSASHNLPVGTLRFCIVR